MREETALQVTDTTFRDAHQSLFATRLRTFDLLRIAPYQAHALPQMLSVECWGGATFDVALRFLHEDPWDRLAALRERMPNQCLQMLLRGRNLLGYERYPEAVVRAFVQEAVAAGIDVFRIFDALNNVEPMRVAIETTLEAGAVAEGALCYTGDLSDPGETTYTLDYYLRLAEQLAEAGVHILAIKDMAGLLRAPAARTLVGALRERFDQPVHLHTHDTAGGQLATYLAALEAGVDAVDGASAPMAGMTSQPALSSIISATDHTERATPLSLEAVLELEPYWEAVRTLYGPFESGLRAPTGRVYRHEIPGGQLSNLRQQAIGARARRPLRGGGGGLRSRRRAAGPHRQGHADEQGGRRPRAVRGLRRDRLGRAARAPAGLRPARVRARLPARRARRAGGWPAAAVRRPARCGRRTRTSRRTTAAGLGRRTGGWPRRAALGARRCPSSSSPARRRTARRRSSATATCPSSPPRGSSTACATARS